jgi:hypothetical protein
MFIPLWNKYLPIIRILMKKSVTGAQTFDMNRTDFERASGGRKAKLSFTMSLHNGRIQNVSNPPPIAKELSVVLQEDEVTRQLVRQYDFTLTMNSSYQLIIKNTSAPENESGDTSNATNDAGDPEAKDMPSV